MKKIYVFKILILFSLLLCVGKLEAQVTIGAEIAPQPHSVLELFAQYNTDVFGALRLPQLSTAERNTITGLDQPSSYGLMIYNTDKHCVEYWNRLKWVSLCTGEATITFSGGIPTDPAFLAAGENRGPFTPHDQPNCTGNPPYSFTVMSGANFLHITVVNESTGQFFVTMDENTTVLLRTGIVRIANNCTFEYKDFLFTQKGATGLCIPDAPAPVLASQNGTAICSGGAVNLYLTDISDGTGYVWTRNGVEIIRDVNYYVAKQSGIYSVYAGAVGCETPPSTSLNVTNTQSNAPAPVSLIAVQNQGFVCSLSGTAKIFATAPASGNLTWYKDGIKQVGLNTTEIQAGIGTWFAMVEDGGCYSVPSNEVVVKLDPNAGTSIPTPTFTVNGSSGNTLQVCSGGMLILEVSSPQPSITYSWYVNSELKGAGTYYEFNMAGVSEDFILQCRASNGNDCSTTGISQISISLGSAPARPELQSSTNGVLCGGSTTLTTTSIAAKYRWYKDNVLLGETNYPNNTYVVSELGMYSLQVIDVQNCASAISTSLNVNKHSAYGAVAISPKPGSVDEKQGVEFTATMNPEDATTTYTWTVTGATASNTTGKTILVTFNDITTAHISVVATNACTPGGVSDTVNGLAGITVIPLCQNAAITYYNPSSKADTVIGSSSTTLSVTPNGNSIDFTYEWYEESDPVTILGATDTYVATATGSYYCIVTPVCTGGNPVQSDDFEVVIITITPANAGDEDQTVCKNSALTPIVFTTVGASNATVAGLPTGLSYNYSAGTLTINGTPTESGTFNYTVTLTDGVVSGVGITGTILTPALPAQPSAITAGTVNPCPGATGLTYSVTNDPLVTTYTWVLPAGWTQTGGGTSNSITVTAGTVGGTFTVTPDSYGCIGTATSGAFTLSFTQGNPTSAIICAGGTYTFSLAAATGPGTLSYQWQQSSDNETWTNATGTSTNANYTTQILTAGSVTYFRRIATSATCGSSITSNSATVTIANGPCVQSSFAPNTSKFVEIDVKVDASGNGSTTPTTTKRLTFLTYNLGANPNLTPKEQMAYPGCVTDMTVFGGWYQWGRKQIDHTFRCDPTSPITSDTRFTTTKFASIAADNGKFWYGTTNSDWLTTSIGTLWGNGNGITLQNPAAGSNNACPSGWRVPTQHEWALLGNEGGNATTHNNDLATLATNITLLNSGLYWVKVNNGRVSSSFTANNMCGYALYTPAEWNKAGADAYRNGTADLFDAAAPIPLIFIPAAGSRDFVTGARGGVGMYGSYWCSTVSGTTYGAYLFQILSESSFNVNCTLTQYRAAGYSVRCIKCGAESCP